MKLIIKIADKYLLKIADPYLKRTLQNEKYEKFFALEKKYKELYYKMLPNIGKTVFTNSYFIASCYFFHFPALKELGFTVDQAISIIWRINEEMVRRMPKAIRKLSGSYYSNQFRRLGPWATEQGRKNKIHPFDWKVEYKRINDQEFTIDIRECYMDKMAKELGMSEMLPGICRMDHLFSHYFHQGFVRTKTLGDGDDRCNCHWTIPGQTEWPIVNEEYR